MRGIGAVTAGWRCVSREREDVGSTATCRMGQRPRNLTLAVWARVGGSLLRNVLVRWNDYAAGFAYPGVQQFTRHLACLCRTAASVDVGGVRSRRYFWFPVVYRQRREFCCCPTFSA